jgi:hypothetical protein
MSLALVSSGFVMILAFQNCSRVGFTESALLASKTGDGRDPGFDPTLDPSRDPGLDPSLTDDRDPGEDLGETEEDLKDDSDWLYIPGGRGHVPMSSVAICPAGSKDEGKQKCPVFCYKGVDYVMHKSLARDYFAKKFDELPNYGGGAVPGTCANPDLKLKK